MVYVNLMSDGMKKVQLICKSETISRVLYFYITLLFQNKWQTTFVRRMYLTV